MAECAEGIEDGVPMRDAEVDVVAIIAEELRIKDYCIDIWTCNASKPFCRITIFKIDGFWCGCVGRTRALRRQMCVNFRLHVRFVICQQVLIDEF